MAKISILKGPPKSTWMCVRVELRFGYVGCRVFKVNPINLTKRLILKNSRWWDLVTKCYLKPVKGKRDHYRVEFRDKPVGIDFYNGIFEMFQNGTELKITETSRLSSGRLTIESSELNRTYTYERLVGYYPGKELEECSE